MKQIRLYRVKSVLYTNLMICINQAACLKIMEGIDNGEKIVERIVSFE